MREAFLLCCRESFQEEMFIISILLGRCLSTVDGYYNFFQIFQALGFFFFSEDASLLLAKGVS